ncbi:MAG: sigma 54-interacting transcriptional regulator [Spirosomataceae bacterium]
MTKNIDLQTVKNRFGIIGNAPALNHALSIAMQVAVTDLTVLITGESGSGKESFSKVIHGLSNRKHGNFIAINCGAIPEGTIDSELFGHVKGSFTGAIDDRKGYFEITDGGTIFLDEIGEMPLGTQARLLRVLENGEFIPVGSSKVKKTNVRVVAATNVNLFQAIEKNTFREDLYYRLSTVPISVPPLRDRGFDIFLLFLKFTTDFAEKQRIQPIELDEEAQRLLLAFRYPGNIRQLKNIAEQITILEQERVITKQILEKYLPKEHASSVPALFKSQFSGGQANDFSERDILYKVLFDMKKDMTELKKLVHLVLQGDLSTKEVLRDHRELFEEIRAEEDLPLLQSRNFAAVTPDVTPSIAYGAVENHAPNPSIVQLDDYHDDRHDVEDITHETEEESLSLEKKEKEMIIRALRKNGFRRKHAARDLGISERTLYRKINQYDIQDE